MTQKMGADRRILLGLPFLLMFGLVIAGHLLELVLAGGEIEGIVQGSQIKQILLGLTGLGVGYFLLDSKIARDRRAGADEANYTLTYGIPLFVVMTVINTFMAGFESYQSVITQQSMVTIAAAPLEEALFRFMLASLLFAAFIEIVPTFRRVVSIPLAMMFRRNIGAQTTHRIDRPVAMLVTSVLVSLVFVWYHASVAPVADPSVFGFFFINSFAYTMVYLYTGCLLASTTAHLAHNLAVTLL